MNSVEIETRLNSQSYIDPGMVEAAFDFWFKDSEHIRSPFPDYIKVDLRVNAIDKLLDWSKQLSDKAKKDINDEILAEKFEEIIFELAHEMAMAEDEKLTIKYPFMLRVNDLINEKNPAGTAEDFKVVGRLYFKDGDHSFMKVRLQNTITGKEKETDFELPE